MFTKLISELRFTRDEFKSKADTIQKERQEKLAVLKRDYREGSASAMAEKERIEAEFNKKLDAARKEAGDYIDSCFADVIEEETKKVRKIDSIAIKSVEALSKLPMTAKELQVINDTFGKNKNYWVEKMLLDIAQRNAISDETLGLESDYETKMDIVTQLQNEYIEMLAEYDGDSSIKKSMYLHDVKLSIAEMRYKNGLNNIGMSAENVAMHAYAKYSNCPDMAQKTVIASNVLKNADEVVKNEFMYLVANSGQDDAMKNCFGKSHEIYNNFKEKDSAEYSAAKKAMKKIKQGEPAHLAVAGLENNRFIADMLQDAKSDYSTIREFLGEESEE